MTRKLIKTFEFDETVRNLVTLGANVRLDPADGRLKLVRLAGGYPTTADLFFKTWLARPASARAWYGFQANAVLPTGTAIKYRLSSDGVSQRFWNGSAWVLAAPGDWNTEAEVSANIASFSAQQRAIQVVANLSTTDVSATPELVWIKVGYEAKINFEEDLFARSLVPALRTLRPEAEHALKVAAATTTVDLSKMETPYNVVGVSAVYNVSTDPAQANNLYQSFDLENKIITLSASVPAGTRLVVEFSFEPEVAMSTSEDYIEFNKVPMILVEDVRESSHYEAGDDAIIANRATGEAWALKGGQQRCYEVTISWSSNKTADVYGMSEKLENFFRDGVLRSSGMDEPYSLLLLDMPAFHPAGNPNDVQTARLTARIRDALFYTSDAKQVFAVKSFQITGNLNVTVE